MSSRVLWPIMWLGMLEVDQSEEHGRAALKLRARKLRALIEAGLAPILAYQSRAGASYDSFSDRSNCRSLRSQSVDDRYCRRAADAWSRGLRGTAILDQYGYRGFDFRKSAMASARTGVVQGFSEKRHSGCRESDDF